VPSGLLSVFFGTRQRSSLPRAKKHSAKKTLGKEALCPVFFFLTLGVFFYTRQKKFKAHFEAVN
jgi:hypothetical protein